MLLQGHDRQYDRSKPWGIDAGASAMAVEGPWLGLCATLTVLQQGRCLHGAHVACMYSLQQATDGGSCLIATYLNSLYPSTRRTRLLPQTPPACVLTWVAWVCECCRPRDPSSAFSWPTPLVARSLSAEDMEMEVRVLPAVTPEQYPTPDPRQLSPEGGPASDAATGGSPAGHDAAAAGEGVLCERVGTECWPASVWVGVATTG
jgi:hypothetical protein